MAFQTRIKQTEFASSEFHIFLFLIFYQLPFNTFSLEPLFLLQPALLDL